MGLENRGKSNQIFDGSKMNVPGQGIKTVQVFKDILKNKNSLFSPSDLQNEKNQPRPTPQPTKTPRPTPNNTPTQTTTPTLTPTMTKSAKPKGTPLPTRTSTKTPVSSSTPTNTLTPTKTIDSTPIPTRTNTPSNTQTGTVALTPSETLTPTPNATPSYTPSMTQTLTPNGCFCYEVNITQTDLDAAYGNEIQSANNKIVVQYYNCYEELITFTASTSGIYYICNRRFESIADFNVECLLTYTQLDLVYTNYLNPDYFTSQITTLFNPCSTTAGCQPPTQTITPTITTTPTYSPTITTTPSFTPSQTITPTLSPSNPETPSVTPSQTITSTPTVTVTEYPCFNFDVTITQTDIDRASGNTEINGVVSIVYYSCDELVQELEVTIAGIYTICNKYKKTNQIYNQNVYLIYTQDDEAYNTYDNPEKFTSSFVRTSTVCPTLPPPPPPPPCNPLDFDPLTFTAISNSNGKSVFFSITLSSNPLVIVDWGDGNIENFENYSLVPASNPVQYLITTTHTFTSNSTGIKIYCCYFDLIINLSIRLQILSVNTFSINLNEIAQKLINIEYLSISTSFIVIGNLSSTSNMNYLNELILRGNEQLIGNIESIPNSLTRLQIIGSYIGGNINNITNTSLIVFEIVSGPIDPYKNFITGDIVSFLNSSPNLLAVTIVGDSVIYGDLNQLTNNVLTRIEMSGDITLTGDISFLPQSINTFNIDGNNTVYGDIANLPQNISVISIKGNNTVTGDISNLPTTSTMSNVSIEGNNTVYGNIANLPYYPNLISLYLGGLNTVSGTLNNLQIGNNIINISITGNNTITGPVDQFMSSILNGTFNYKELIFTPIFPGGLTSNEVDYVLNQFVSRQFAGPQLLPKVILNGTCQPRTTNSDIAVTYLQSIGVTVNTN